jgi:hypothetical protein
MQSCLTFHKVLRIRFYRCVMGVKSFYYGILRKLAHYYLCPY